jgi:hypothetical protein
VHCGDSGLEEVSRSCERVQGVHARLYRKAKTKVQQIVDYALEQIKISFSDSS